MLTDADIERFDSLMSTVMQRREDRGFDVPDRDEEKIAEILSNAERRSADEHTLWLQSKEQFASTVKFQEAAIDSDEVKEFPQMDNYRNFDFE